MWFSRSILSFSLFLSERFRLPCLPPVAVIVDAPLILPSKVLAFLTREVGRFGNIELCFPWLISTSLFSKTWLCLFKRICCSENDLLSFIVSYLVEWKSCCESFSHSFSPSSDSSPFPNSTIESFLCPWFLSSVVCDSCTRCTGQSSDSYWSKTKFSIILSCTCLGAIIFSNWIKLFTSLKVSNCDYLKVCESLFRSLNAEVVAFL